MPLGAGLLAPGALPVLYPTGLFLLLATAALVWAAVRLRRVRAVLGTRERRLPEAAALAANVAALLWTSREAGRTARILMPGATIGPGDGSPTAWEYRSATTHRP